MLARAGGLGAIAAAMLISAPASAWAEKIDFDIAEQAAVTGIPSFARQARIQIIAPAVPSASRTGSVRGRLSVESGLRRLLRGTDLTIAASKNGIISLAVRRRRPARLSPTRPSAPPAGRTPPAAAEEIIVTGTGRPERRVDAGLAITTATLDRIHALAPTNTADILKLAPGIWAETTGGTTGANVFVRGFPTTGDAPFLTVQLDGAPIFPPTELAFSENTTLFRVDDMIAKVEILRGGTGPIFANGQPGAVINFIQRTGTSQLEGGLRLTGTDYGTKRADAYLAGPVATDTSFAIGGFYRASDGIRDTEFPADRGGQITGNITHHFAEGVATAYVRYTRDRNAFYTGAPLLADGVGGFRALPGFDPLNDTLIGKDTRQLSIEVGPAMFEPLRLDEGRGLDLFSAGAMLDWVPDDRIQLTNRTNLTSGRADTIGLFTGPVPTTLGQYIAASIARANANPRIISESGRAGAGQGFLVASGAPVALDRYVLTAGAWSVKKKIMSVTNEFRLSAKPHPAHQVIAGAYIAHYRSDDTRRFGNNLLLLAEPNARRIDLRLDNGVKVTRDGFVSAVTGQLVGHNSATNLAVYLSDKWAASPRVAIDAGVRIERQSLDGRIRNVAQDIDFDGDPRTLYNNNGTELLPTTTAYRHDSLRFSWTTGAVHRLVPDRLTLHARFSQSAVLQSFEKLRIGGPRSQSVDVLEIGTTLSSMSVRASINVFRNRFKGLQFTRMLALPDGSVGSIVLLGGARAAGIEFDADVSLDAAWQLELRGTYVDGRYRGFGNNVGNRVVRQPDIQFMISPSYSFAIGPIDAKLRMAYNHVGERFSDIENLQRLPSYRTIDASVHLDIGNGLYADLVAQNLLNAFGLTEGNTRLLGDVLSSGAIIARPLFGRNVSLSVGFRF